MYYIKKEDRYRIAPLFDGWNETLLWSCLQGYMGEAWADDFQNPQSAQIVTADFCFFAGIANAGLVRNIPKSFPSSCIMMIPQNDAWANLIEQKYKHNSHRFTRYAIKKEPDIFDTQKLRSYIERLPNEYYISKIDEKIYNKARAEEWSKDLCSQFADFQDYEERGLGFAVLKNEMLVCGASSYTVYDKGIEIQIDTKNEFRRKGLALACASALILECIERKLYPSWDAANKESVALSQKLGYHFDKEYPAYDIILNPPKKI